jgi:hypothetical protein
MATWKKVIVSGSAAHLLNVTASNLTNDNLVIAGVNGALESSGLTYNGTLLNLGTAQVKAAGFSGSFSGSFQGDGAGLTGIVATGTSLQNAIASGEGIAPFSYTNIAPVSVAVSGAIDLTDNAITKWDNNDGKFQTSSLIDNGTAITGVTSIQLTGANSNLSGSFSGSHFGSLTGTASYATQALSASFASTAPYSGLTGIPTGIVSASVLTSPAQGQALLTTNGVAGLTVDLGLETTDSPQFVNLTLTGDLSVLGTTTTIQTNNLLVEDQFILVSSGSANNSTDGGIIVDRGTYAAGNTALGYDATSFRWGLQNGLADPTNTVDLGAASGGVSGSFLAHVFTEAVHGATKPITGEFAVAGAIYTSTLEDIWIYS